MRRGAPYSHCRHRGIDLHVAGLGDVAGDEGERTPGEAEEGRVGLPGRVVNEFVHFHAGVARQVKRAAVGEVDADPTVGAGFDHVAAVDGIADLRAGLVVGQSSLNDRGAGMLYRHLTDGGHDLADRLEVLCPGGIRRRACQKQEAQKTRDYRASVHPSPPVQKSDSLRRNGGLLTVNKLAHFGLKNRINIS